MAGAAPGRPAPDAGGAPAHPGSPFEDELPLGLAPYRPGDPPKRIAWRASARHDALLVREFPPVREVATCLFLDLGLQRWQDRGRGPELAVSLAASLALAPDLTGRPLALGTWAATLVRGAPEPEGDPGRIWLPPASGPASTGRLLRVLAAVVPRAAPPFAALLESLGPRIPWGAQSVWIVPEDTPELRAVALMWQSRGHPVTLICVERRRGPFRQRLGGVTLQSWEVEDGVGLAFH